MAILSSLDVREHWRHIEVVRITRHFRGLERQNVAFQADIHDQVGD